VSNPPPWLSSTRSRRRRPVLVALACLLGLAALAGAVVAIVRAKGSPAPHASAAVHTAAVAAAPPPPPALSPVGLTLAQPAFALHAPASRGASAVDVRFRTPPRAGMLVDLRSGRVLWQRNATRRLPIASLTKIMTALLAVEADPPDAPVLITRQATGANGSKVGLLPVGRHVPFESLLYGLMLPSGNDAAVALADQVAGSVARFVARMNVRAAQLGLGCTRFSSPHGFYDAGNFSCADDLAVLTHVAMEQPRIERVARTLHAVVPFPIKGGKLYLNNNNPLLVLGYPGAIGLKTGYTVASGRCLIAVVERHGVRLAVVLLDSPATATQARALFDRAFRGVYHQRSAPLPPFPAGA
jgi:serine-type D-Ala-D-Ala carboxypeptidase (penicillin-binding protein 5/6)